MKSRRAFNKNSCDLLTAITYAKILVAYFIISDKKLSISFTLRQQKQNYYESKMVDDVIVAVVPIGDFSKKNYNEL